MNIPWSAIIAVFIYVIGSTFGFVWWMATQTIKLEMALDSLKEIKKTLNASEATYATKVEVAKDFSGRDKQIDAMWKKLDLIKT